MNDAEPDQMKSQEKSRILIVDDHPIVRQGYAQLIGNHPELQVCAAAASESEALEQVKATDPDLAIVDITLKDSNGIELIKEISARYPQLKILVVSAHDEGLYAERALDAGALGYVNKQEATDRLVEAVRHVLGGDVYVSQEITRKLLKRRTKAGKQQDKAAPIETLTDRELQVYEMIGHGQTTKKIAAHLHLSPKTVERYKENIKKKLDISNSTELVQQATHWVLERG